MPKIPMAVPRWWVGNTWNSRTIDSGCTSPAAAPWMTRATVSACSLGARPPSTEPSMNTNSAPFMPARKPKDLFTQSVSSMVAVMAARKPVAIHCACTWPMPKAPITSGIATFTIVVESTTAIEAIVTVRVAHQR
jgi:hypothetical protein